jgi:hypothetical protein
MSEDKACRAEFEAWVQSTTTADVTHFLRKCTQPGFLDLYAETKAHYMWEAWQACWSRAAKPAVPEAYGTDEFGQRLIAALIDQFKGYTTLGDIALAYPQEWEDDKVKIRAAMLSAAPTPPAPKEPPSLATLIERANATLAAFEVPKEPT